MKRLLVIGVAAAVLSPLSALLADCPESRFTFISPCGEWKSETKGKGGLRVAAFAKTIANESDVAKVEISAAALGCYELYVNGSLVSSAEDGNRSDYLRAGATDPVLRRAYLTYDVTRLWKKWDGVQNVVSAFVAASWFSDCLGGRCDVKPAFAAKITTTGTDGKTACFATDAMWCASFDTPFSVAGIYEGETFDGRICQCAEKCAGSAPAEVNTNFTGTTAKAEGPGVSLRRDLAIDPVAAYKYSGVEGADKDMFGRARKTGIFRPGEQMRIGAGETLVVDFGQNAAAIPEIVATAKAGTVLRFRGAEMLNDANGERSRGNDGPAGSIYRESFRSIRDKGAGSVRPAASLALPVADVPGQGLDYVLARVAERLAYLVEDAGSLRLPGIAVGAALFSDIFRL